MTLINRNAPAGARLHRDATAAELRTAADTSHEVVVDRFTLAQSRLVTLVPDPAAGGIGTSPSDPAATLPPDPAADEPRRRVAAPPAKQRSVRLGLGAVGTSVRQLEAALKARGALNGGVDGVFDQRTAAAVRKFERQHGFKGDGIADIRVWRKLGLSTGLKRSATFTTSNLNIKNNPPMSHQRLMHDVRKAAKGADLVGWNEIKPESYKKAIRSMGPDWGHFMPGGGGQTPISWRKSVWEKLDAGAELMHKGRARVSPHRYVTWVKLKHRETGETIVRMNTHMVSGAWSKKPQSHRQWRQDMWNQHITKLKGMVDRFTKNGQTVIVGGDFNRNHFPVLGKKRVIYGNSLKAGTHGRSTLDYLMHAPDPSIRKVSGGVRRGFNSDHDAPIVKYQLKRS